MISLLVLLAFEGLVHSSHRGPDLKSNSQVTILAGCKITPEDSAIFSKAFTSWIATGVDEILVVDWQSEVDVLKLLERPLGTSPGAGVTIISVPPRSSWTWRIGAAVNLGLSHVKTYFVAKVDCDTLLLPSFFGSNSLDHAVLRYGDYRAARSENDRHLNGVFFSRTDHVRRVHGFDERLELYGWDDSDLYARISSSIDSEEGKKYLQISQSFTPATGMLTRRTFTGIEHLRHARRKHSRFEMFTTCFNRAGLELLPKWESEHKKRHVCSLRSISHPRINHQTCVPSGRPPLSLQNALGCTKCTRIALDCSKGHVYGGNYGVLDPELLDTLELCCKS